MRKEAEHTGEDSSSRNSKLKGQAARDGGCSSNRFQHDVFRGPFVILRKLQVEDLPARWRHQETLDVIKRVAQRVVRIRIPRLSTRRPANIYNDQAEYGGTGFAYYVDHQVVKVRTNMHVVFDEEEAGMAIIDFFLDLPNRKNPKWIQIRGSKHDFDWSTSEDYASITCPPTAQFLRYLEVFTDIPILWERSFFQDTWCQVQETFPKGKEDSGVVPSDGRRVAQLSETSRHCEQFKNPQDPLSNTSHPDRNSKGDTRYDIDLQDRSTDGRGENVSVLQSLMNDDAGQQDEKREQHEISREISTKGGYVTEEAPKYLGHECGHQEITRFLSEAKGAHTEQFLEETEKGKLSKVNLRVFPDEISAHTNSKSCKAGGRTEKLGCSLKTHTPCRKTRCGVESHADKQHLHEEGMRKQKEEDERGNSPQKPERNSSNKQGRRASAGQSVLSDTLDPEDYVIILSHPNGGEKSFSVGQAFVFRSQGVAARTVPAVKYSDVQQQATSHDNRRATASNSGGCCRLEGESVCFTLPKRGVGLNRDRYYSTQSSYGCSGAPVLILKHCLRHLRIPILDTSQHSGTCFLQNGISFGYATAFMPALYGSSRCPERVSATALLHFAAARLKEDALLQDMTRRTGSHWPSGFHSDRTEQNGVALTEQNADWEMPQSSYVTEPADRGGDAGFHDVSASQIDIVNVLDDWHWSADCQRNSGTSEADISNFRSMTKETEQDKHSWGGQRSVARGRPCHVDEKHIQEAKTKIDRHLIRSHKTLARLKLDHLYPAVDHLNRGGIYVDSHGSSFIAHDKRSTFMLESGASSELVSQWAASDAPSQECRSAGLVMGHARVACHTNKTCQISVTSPIHPSSENFQVGDIRLDPSIVQVGASMPLVKAQNVQFASNVTSAVENIKTIPRACSPKVHQNLLVQSLATAVPGTDQRDLLVLPGMQIYRYDEEKTRNFCSAKATCSTSLTLPPSIHHVLDEERQVCSVQNRRIVSTNVGRSDVQHDVITRFSSYLWCPSGECFHPDQNTMSNLETNQSLHKTVNPFALSTCDCPPGAIPRASPRNEGQVNTELYPHVQTQDFFDEGAEEPYPGFLCDIRGQLERVRAAQLDT